MKVTRRGLLKTAFTAASIIALSQILNDPLLALAAEEAKKILSGKQESPFHVIWIQTQACSGCSVSLLNAVEPSILDVLNGQLEKVGEVSLDFHPTIMARWGVEHLTGTEDSSVADWDAVTILEKVENGELEPYILVTEGAFADEDYARTLGNNNEAYWCSIGAHNGNKIITGTDYLKAVASNAQAVVAVGACASFGGIPHGTPNPTHTTGTVGILGESYRSKLNLPVINVPGCPPAGDWIIKTLARLLLTVKGMLPVPELDEYLRPKFLYGQTTHELCPRGIYYASGKFVTDYGEPYCVFEKGCKGPISRCPINKTGFVEGVGACTAYGSPCIGCTEPAFPDPPTSPFLKPMPAIVVPSMESLSLAAIAGAALGGVVAYSLHSKRKRILTKAKTPALPSTPSETAEAEGEVEEVKEEEGEGE